MKNILLVLIIFISFKGYSQQEFVQNIRGVILDKQSLTPLPGASVILLNTDPIVGTITNENGDFKIENVKIGRVSLKVSYLGYNTIQLNNLMLTSGKELILNIELEETVLSTAEVEVKAYSKNGEAINKMALVSARSFDSEQTERFAGSLGDPARMVANYAGVMSVSDQRNDIVIRGNSPMGILWRLDGVDIPNPNHFGALGTTGGPVSILNNNLLTKSDFFTGAFPAEYGNALSGAFDLKMRSGNNEKHEFIGQIGFNGFELGAEGPFSKNSKASYLANYRYSTLGFFHAIGINLGTGASIPQYQDLSFKVDIPTKKMGKFTLTGIGGISYIELFESKKDSGDWSFGLSSTNTKFASDMGTVILSHLYFFNESTRIKTNFSVQGVYNATEVDSVDNDFEVKNPYYRAYSSEIKYVLSSNIHKKFNSKNNIALGTSFDLYNINYVDSFMIPGATMFLTRLNSVGQLGLFQSFIEWQHKFTNLLTLYSGVHYQLFTLNSSQTVEPRLGLKWNFHEKHSLNLGAGMHSQMQPRMVYFFETELTDGSYTQTNNDLDFSKSNHVVLGYEFLPIKNSRIKFETYYQYLTDIPVLESHPEFSNLNDGDFFTINMNDSLINSGTGKNYGVELTIEKFLSKGFYFLFTSSIFDSKYTGYDKIERNTVFNGNYVFNALTGYEIKINNRSTLAIDLRSVFAGGKRYIPVDLEKSRIEKTTVLEWNRAYEKKYGDYFKIDARITFRLNGKKINQEWAVDIQNMTNHKNIFLESFDVNKGELRRDYQTGFFPMAMWRIYF